MVFAIFRYLDHIVGSHFDNCDPQATRIESHEYARAIRERSKEIVKWAFGYCNDFGLDKTLLENCVVFRRMSAFVRCYKEYALAQKDHDSFLGKAIYTIGDSERMQQAVLKYLSNYNAIYVGRLLAFCIALPADRWPDNLRCNNEEISRIETEICERFVV